MKKFLPYILPALAVILVVVFAVRWYKNRTATPLDAPEVSAGAEIEELSVSELESLENMSRGLGKYESTKLASDQADTNSTGEVRFEKKDNKVYFTVTANLPEIVAGNYQLWLKTAGSDQFVPSKPLTLGKAGLIAATALAQENLPVTLEVRLGDQVVLSGELK